MPPTAELEAPATETKPEGKPPVTPPGEPTLAEVFKKTLAANDAANKAGAEKPQDGKPSEADAALQKEQDARKATEAELAAKKAVEDKAADKRAAETAKKSPLDAVLDKTAKTDAATDEIPANAPAKQLREAMERHKAESAKWKAEAEKAKSGDPQTKQELEAIRQEREALKAENIKLRDAVTALNVEYDPTVQEKYVAGRERLVDKAAFDVEQYGGDSKAFREALGFKGRQQTEGIRAALAEVDEVDRAAILDKVSKIRALDEEKADLLRDSQGSYKKLSEAQQQRALQEQEHAEQAKKAIFDRIAKDLPSKHPLLSPVGADADGAEDWNRDLASDHEKARHAISSDADWNEINEIALKGARYDRVEEMLIEERRARREDVESLKSELQKYQSAEPGFEGRHKTDVVSKLDKTPAQIYREEMERLKSRNDE